MKFSQAAAAPADGQLRKTSRKPAGAAQWMRCACCVNVCGCKCALSHDFIITSCSPGRAAGDLSSDLTSDITADEALLQLRGITGSCD